MRSVPFTLRARVVRLALVVAVSTSMIVFVTPRGASAAPSSVDYRPPSDAPLIDHFRPPPKPWMAGNRGIDYGTEPGAQVWAAGDGRVIFAGQVGGQLHVTVEHPDGLRTSYSFLASISVDVGDRVHGGEVIGIAGGPFHFGVRAPDNSYLDPEALLAGSLRPSVRLIPGTDQGLERLGAQERRSLLETLLGDGVAALSVAASFSSRTSALLTHYVVELNPETHAARLAFAVGKWFEDRQACTEPSTPVPSHTSRRIVVLVSGLGTSSDSNTAWEIDTKSLGYANADVVRYSYEGGQAPRVSNDQGSTLRSVVSQPLDAITTRPFTATDSQQSVGTSADRLADLLQSVAIAQPGVPIDVVGHSQGGVVARLAVERSGAEKQLPSEVQTLVTVSSPQQGAPLATGVVALADTPGGAAALSQVRAAGMADDLDNRRPALADLAETSATMDELHNRPIPAGVRFVTIGGSGDLVVPGSSAGDSSADASIILPTAIGKEAHGSLPSTPEATREIGLAVAGMGPTCQSFGVALSGFLTAETVRYGETLASANAAIGAGVLPIPPAD